MELIGMILQWAGIIGLFVTALWLLILQFQTSIFWGLACIFIPFVSLIWLILHWEDGKMPFLYSLLFAVVFFGGMFMGGNI